MRSAEHYAARACSRIVKPKNGSMSSTRRERILRRDGYHCLYCGTPYAAEELTLDHVEPRVKGGDRSDGNLVTCCRACNAIKGGQPAWSFLAQRPEMRASLLARAGELWPRLRRAIEEAAVEEQS
ncbi:MAG: HNH endonuclease [Longimicrobiales bacterium]